MTGSNRAPALRDGLSLMEAMIAMTLLSVVLVSLAPVLFQTVSRQRVDAMRLERTGVLVGETNRLLALPFDALDAEAGCEEFSGPAALAHERCITVSGTGRSRSIRIVVVPADSAVGADSTLFTRTRTTGSINPFDTGTP